MGPRLAIVASPRARLFRHQPDELARLEATAGDGALVAPCDDPASTTAFLEAALDAEVEIIAVAGGDGTTGHVIARAAEVWGAAGLPLPAFALLRGGTMNTVANGLGLSRGSPTALLSRLRERLRPGSAALEVVERPTIEVEGRVGFLFGTGVFQSFLRAYYAKGKGDPTVVTAAQTIAHTVGSVVTRGAFAKKMAGQEALQVETDGERWPDARYLAVAAGTVSEVGLGFKAFHLAPLYRGAFSASPHPPPAWSWTSRPCGSAAGSARRTGGTSSRGKPASSRCPDAPSTTWSTETFSRPRARST
jgi:diacylglycerol kinase (ATP)